MRRDSRLGNCLSPSWSLALLSSYSRRLAVEFAELLPSAYFAAHLKLNRQQKGVCPLTLAYRGPSPLLGFPTKPGLVSAHCGE